MEGLAAGQNPKATALEIVGRLDRASGKRVGGLIGLSGPQIEYVKSAKAELRDPERMRHYLGRSLRDKRFDRMVMRGIKDGKGLNEADASRIAQRYADKMLKHRGDMIARTETLSALHAAQYQAMQQLIDTGAVRADQVQKTWSATGDARTRDSHRDMNGQKVAFGAPFITPSGARMRYPQDTALGAPAEEIIGCRCYMQVKVNYLPDTP